MNWILFSFLFVLNYQPTQVCPPGEKNYIWDCNVRAQCDSGNGPEWMKLDLRVMAYDELGARAEAAADTAEMCSAKARPPIKSKIAFQSVTCRQISPVN